MTRKPVDENDWFPPKRYGYGAGLPIAWQGWAVLGAYGAAMALFVWLVQSLDIAMQIGAAALLLAATLALVLATRRHTRGGWRWRWGDED